MENDPKLLTRAYARFTGAVVVLVSSLLTLGTLPAAAQDRMMFPATENARAEILRLIRNETVRIDIGIWLLGDGEERRPS